MDTGSWPAHLPPGFFSNLELQVPASARVSETPPWDSLYKSAPQVGGHAPWPAHLAGGLFAGLALPDEGCARVSEAPPGDLVGGSAPQAWGLTPWPTHLAGGTFAGPELQDRRCDLASETPPGDSVYGSAPQAWGLAPWPAHQAGVFLSGLELQDLGCARVLETPPGDYADEQAPQAWGLAPWPTHLAGGFFAVSELQVGGYLLVSETPPVGSVYGAAPQAGGPAPWPAHSAGVLFPGLELQDLGSTCVLETPPGDSVYGSAPQAWGLALGPAHLAGGSFAGSERQGWRLVLVSETQPGDTIYGSAPQAWGLASWPAHLTGVFFRGLELQDLDCACVLEAPPEDFVCGSTPQAWGLTPWPTHLAGGTFAGPELQDRRCDLASETPPGDSVFGSAPQAWGLAPWPAHQAGVFLSGLELQDLGCARVLETPPGDYADEQAPQAWGLAPWPTHLAGGFFAVSELQVGGYLLVSETPPVGSVYGAAPQAGGPAPWPAHSAGVLFPGLELQDLGSTCVLETPPGDSVYGSAPQAWGLALGPAHLAGGSFAESERQGWRLVLVSETQPGDTIYGSAPQAWGLASWPAHLTGVFFRGLELQDLGCACVLEAPPEDFVCGSAPQAWGSTPWPTHLAGGSFAGPELQDRRCDLASETPPGDSVYGSAPQAWGHARWTAHLTGGSFYMPELQAWSCAAWSELRAPGFVCRLESKAHGLAHWPELLMSGFDPKSEPEGSGGVPWLWLPVEDFVGGPELLAHSGGPWSVQPTVGAASGLLTWYSVPGLDWQDRSCDLWVGLLAAGSLYGSEHQTHDLAVGPKLLPWQVELHSLLRNSNLPWHFVSASKRRAPCGATRFETPLLGFAFESELQAHGAAVWPNPLPSSTVSLPALATWGSISGQEQLETGCAAWPGPQALHPVSEPELQTYGYARWLEPPTSGTRSFFYGPEPWDSGYALELKAPQRGSLCGLAPQTRGLALWMVLLTGGPVPGQEPQGSGNAPGLEIPVSYVAAGTKLHVFCFAPQPEPPPSGHSPCLELRAASHLVSVIPRKQCKCQLRMRPKDIDKTYPSHPMADSDDGPSQVGPETLVRLFIVLENILLFGFIFRALSVQICDIFNKPNWQKTHHRAFRVMKQAATRPVSATAPRLLLLSLLFVGVSGVGAALVDRTAMRLSVKSLGYQGLPAPPLGLLTRSLSYSTQTPQSRTVRVPPPGHAVAEQAVKRPEQFQTAFRLRHRHYFPSTGEGLCGPLSWLGHSRVDNESATSTAACAVWRRNLAMAHCGLKASKTKASRAAPFDKLLLTILWLVCGVILRLWKTPSTNERSTGVMALELAILPRPWHSPLMSERTTDAMALEPGSLSRNTTAGPPVDGTDKNPPEPTGCPVPSSTASERARSADGTDPSQKSQQDRPPGSRDDGGGREDRDGNAPSEGGDRTVPQTSGRHKRGRKRRRSTSPLPDRQLRARRPPAPGRPSGADFTIYIVGPGFGHSTAQLLEGMVACLHRDQEVTARCDRIRAAAQQYLKAERSRCGWGYVATEDIPSDLEICYYSGILIPTEHGTSNYCIDLGKHYHTKVAIDGSPEDAHEPELGRMQIVNHSCYPNCVAAHRETQDGLGILCLATSRNIRKGENITFSYGGSFWSKGAPVRVRGGYKIVHCLCQGDVCPNALWRKERVDRTSGSDQTDRLRRGRELGPRQSGRRQSILPVSSTQPGLTFSDSPERQSKAGRDPGFPDSDPPLQGVSPSVDPGASRRDPDPPFAPRYEEDRDTGQDVEVRESPGRRKIGTDSAPKARPAPCTNVQSARKTSTGSGPIDGESAGAETREPPDVAGGPTRRNPFLDLFMPWKPGTKVVYRKPRGGQSRPAEFGFPIWAVAGGPPLEAMFLAADQICRNAFYVAADQWNESRLVKEFGAFASAEEFLRTLQRSPVRCYYEIIRADRPCKAYLDVEADKGALSREAGEALLETTVKLWMDLVCSKWPACTRECPKALEVIVLDGSRPTKDGWKVSYHLVFPWLTFPRNDGVLKELVQELSVHAALQYPSRQGTMKPFVDGLVYTKNRQFRTVWSWKLDDSTTSGLQARGDNADERLLLTFVTRTEDESWKVPDAAAISKPRCPATIRSKPPHRGDETPVRRMPEDCAGRLNSILELLRQNGHPPGRLTHSGGRNFRWQAQGRPCVYAQAWRPEDPHHGSNGSTITVQPNGAVYVRCLHSRCQQHGSVEGEYLGMLFDEPGPVAARGEAVPSEQGAVTIEAVGARVDPAPVPSVPRTSPQPALPASVPKPTGQCLRLAMRQIQLDDDGPCSRPSPTERSGKLPPNVHATLGPPSRTDQELQRVETWLSTPGSGPPPNVDLRLALQPLVEPRGLKRGTCALGSNAEGSAPRSLRTKISEPSRSPQEAARSDEWECRPPTPWFTSPIGARPKVGHGLLADAMQRLSQASPSQSLDLPLHRDSSESRYEWAGEDVRVGALNVGLRGLAASCDGVAQLLATSRCDLLFLSDLRATRRKIGKIRKTLETAVLGEWTLLTSIDQASSRACGMGVLVHASLASQAHPVDLTRPSSIREDEWREATDGRLLLLQLNFQVATKTWWVVGIYQHVAKPENSQKRQHLLTCLAGIREQASQHGYHLLILGDANAAPAGGRWHCPRHSPLHASDARTAEWAQHHGLTEVPRPRMIPTWRASLKRCSAVLDRAWYSPATLGISRVHTRWADVAAQFDHALIFVQLPSREAGTGFAGACRNGWKERPAPRLRVDMELLAARRDEFAITVSKELEALCTEVQTDNPFETLTAVNEIASQVAQRLAPRASGYLDSGMRQRPFMFRGHRALTREINWLHQARKVVKRVLDDDAAFLAASERRTMWDMWVKRLKMNLRRSVVERPPALEEPFEAYLRADQKPALTLWLKIALDAIHSRQAIIRSAFDRAVETNLRRLRGRVRKSNGAIDADMIQAALGRTPARQRIWGISGQVPLGVGLRCPPAWAPEMIEQLRGLRSTEAAQRVAGNADEIRIWFRGPRPLGDFLAEWSQQGHGAQIQLRLLDSPDSYIAVMPDDMLAMEELYLARQGMADASKCLGCQWGEVLPIVTSARHQPLGCAQRAVRFFCPRCCSVREDVDCGPDPPCPIPDEIWATMRKFPSDMGAFLSRPMDLDSLRERIRKLPKGRAPGRDGIPYEYFQYGPSELHGHLLAAVNAFMSGSHPLPSEWLGGLVTLIPKAADATTMKKFRPISNISTGYKLCAAEVADRMARTLEEHGAWHDSQEGGRRGRGTKRQIFKLLQMLEQGQRERTVAIVVQLDFNTAFTSTNMNAVYRTLEAYGVPTADIALLKRMQSGSWYSVANPFGETAACAIRKGMKQGCPTSPNNYLICKDPLLRMLSASGRGWSLPTRGPMRGLDHEARGSATRKLPSESDPGSAFIDDLILVILGGMAIIDTIALLALVVTWECWAGVRVNLSKSGCAAYDYARRCKISIEQVLYRGLSLPELLPDKPFRYLGMLLTLTLDFSFEKDRIIKATKERVAVLAKADFLSPSQRELAVQLAVISIFRYTAGLVPWRLSELEELTAEWVRGYRGAWALPRSTDDSLFRVGRGLGGRGCPSALSVWITEATGLISQCMRKPGVIAQLMVDDLQRTCASRGCQTLFQLQRMVRVISPRAIKSRTELLVSRLDGIGLDVTGVPWTVPTSNKLLLFEAVWPTLWAAFKTRPPLGAQGPARDCRRAVEKLAAVGIWSAAQLSAGPGLWLTWRSLPSRCVTENEYDALLAELRVCPYLERISAERSELRGQRQLTLQESLSGAYVARETTGSNGPDIAQAPRVYPCNEAQRGTRKHPWQLEPRLPTKVVIDCASDAPLLPPAPEGWTLLQRNGRLMVRKPSGITCQLEAAQAGMLELMNQGMDQEAFLDSLVTACLTQQRQDGVRAVHWSRHLLACVARVTGARGLVGCRAVTFHPHYWWFSSPEEEAWGSLKVWPVEVCVLLLDAYSPEERNAVLRRAFGHGAHVWILRLVEPGEASTRDLRSLVDLRAQLFARLPKRSLVLHARECWSEGHYDAKPAKHAMEIWRLGRADQQRALVSPTAFLHALGSWEARREDFHWPEEDHPIAWDFYMESQQDAAQRGWDGIVAAIDGSVDRKTETMGAGFVVGTGPQPVDSLSFPVGGPLASLRGEAAGLDCLLDRVEPSKPLLVFTDCLVLLTILDRWGRVDFWPEPDDVKHFDIISSCLQKLRRRTGDTHLVKVKSHSGLLMNDRADALAEQGRISEEPPRWPGSRKLEPLHLVVRQKVRDAHPTLPDNNVPDKLLIRRAVELAELAAACMKDTIFSREMLQDRTNCGPVLDSVVSMPDSTVRLWMQVATGQYPTTARLHKMFPQKYYTATCPWCQLGVPETLGHFLTQCPRFREARTEAHNRCWRAIMKKLVGILPTDWQVYHDKPMSDTGLLAPLDEPSNARPAMDGAPDDPQGARSTSNLLRLRPDAVAVNHVLQRVAILEHCRPHDTVDRDRPDPPQSSPATLDSERVARGMGTVEIGAASLAPGAAAHEDAESEARHGNDFEEEGGPPEAQVRDVRTCNRQCILAAYERKKDKYQDLARAVGERLREPGWKVEVLPWVVGTRGVLDAAGIQQAMTFLEIPASKRKEMLRKSAAASVEALVYMHRVRKSGTSRGRIRVVSEEWTGPEGGKCLKRRRGGEDAGECMERWRRLSTDPMRINLQQWKGKESRRTGAGRGWTENRSSG